MSLCDMKELKKTYWNIAVEEDETKKTHDESPTHTERQPLILFHRKWENSTFLVNCFICVSPYLYYQPKNNKAIEEMSGVIEHDRRRSCKRRRRLMHFKSQPKKNRAIKSIWIAYERKSRENTDKNALHTIKKGLKKQSFFFATTISIAQKNEKKLVVFFRCPCLLRDIRFFETPLHFHSFTQKCVKIHIQFVIYSLKIFVKGFFSSSLSTQS